VLEPEDTVALMKSISPERCQRELQEIRTSDFRFLRLGTRLASACRFSGARGCGHVAAVDPTEAHDPEDLAGGHRHQLVMRPRGLFLVDGPDGCGKSTTLASLVKLIMRTWITHHHH